MTRISFVRIVAVFRFYINMLSMVSAASPVVAVVILWECLGLWISSLVNMALWLPS